MRYFADRNDGSTVQFDKVDYRPITAGTNGPCEPWGYDKVTGEWIKVTRSIKYKAFGSKHECDSRCINAAGKSMNCECACGGKNHGKGKFNCNQQLTLYN